MTTREREQRLAAELRGEVCRCGCSKQAWTHFCLACWEQLPRVLRDGLINNDGADYAHYYERAVEHLRLETRRATS